MNAADWAWLALGAAIASPVRYWAGAAAKSTRRRPFPAGTFAVNCAACLLLGIALEMRVPRAWVQSLVAVGVCGALSTWSTLAWETVDLLRTDRLRTGALYLAASLLAGVTLAWAGTMAGRWIW
ncbi:fluoride efflux transporter FluC [Streptomyces sp. SudanB182_2057]|uniref:fluoride efflux transporter FluC n=1 Tax=Streptomyces sp. SudanB182_2057 TaxID=3035281 RepID=UPI003F557347